MPQNGQTLKVFQQILQDFVSVSDHFRAVCNKASKDKNRNTSKRCKTLPGHIPRRRRT